LSISKLTTLYNSSYELTKDPLVLYLPLTMSVGTESIWYCLASLEAFFTRISVPKESKILANDSPS